MFKVSAVLLVTLMCLAQPLLATPAMVPSEITSDPQVSELLSGMWDAIFDVARYDFNETVNCVLTVKCVFDGWVKLVKYLIAMEGFDFGKVLEKAYDYLIDEPMVCSFHCITPVFYVLNLWPMYGAWDFEHFKMTLLLRIAFGADQLVTAAAEIVMGRTENDRYYVGRGIGRIMWVLLVK